MSPPLRQQIEARASESAIRSLAKQEGMTLLRQDALLKIETGPTTPEEVARIVQVEDRLLHCPECLHSIEKTFAVCPYCLYQLQVQCASCGAAVEKEWKSCPYCGPTKPAEALPTPTLAPTPTPTPAPAPALIAVRPELPPLGAIDVPTVLIIDDHKEIRKLVRLTLEHGPVPLRCEEAANGFEAIGKIEMSKPHLIVLDLMMPGMTGAELCKRLRAKLSTALIPVIMLTALADVESKKLGFLAGSDDYLTKPFEREELAARVHRLLERTYGWRAEEKTAAVG
jgi:CheY-like chemotaxis protein/RNA polymerase subunit RPABC4/transcription elongation factor Spt4